MENTLILQYICSPYARQFGQFIQPNTINRSHIINYTKYESKKIELEIYLSIPYQNASRSLADLHT